LALEDKMMHTRAYFGVALVAAFGVVLTLSAPVSADAWPWRATRRAPVLPVTSLPASPGDQAVLINASVQSPIANRGASQTLYVRVTDAQGRAIANAPVKATIQDASSPRVILLPMTDAYGYSMCTFTVGNERPGFAVVIDVSVQHKGAEFQTRTSYIPW
jgi:hypothetical protein